MSEDLRRCSDCEQWKPVRGFHQTHCTDCNRRRAREWYAANRKRPERVLEFGKVESLTHSQRAYIAGILDGEGYLAVARRETAYYARIIVSNTDRRLVDWLVDITGLGCLYLHIPRNPNSRPCWKWNLIGRPARAVLLACQDFLVIKRDQAELNPLPAMLWQCLKRCGRRGGAARSPEEMWEAQKIESSVRSLHLGFKSRRQATP